MAVEEAYGAAAEFSTSIRLPSSLDDRAEANRAMQEEVAKLSAQLRDDTVDLAELLRVKLGFTNADAAEVLHVDPSTLSRMTSGARFKAE